MLHIRLRKKDGSIKDLLEIWDIDNIDDHDDDTEMVQVLRHLKNACETIENLKDNKDEELVQLKIAVRSLLDDVNKRYPDKNPREWNCKHMQLLDELTRSK